MSIGHSNVHSSNGRTEMSIGHSNVHSSNGRMLNTSVSHPKGVMLDRITSFQQFWHCKKKMSIGQTEMSIGHSYVHSSSGRTEMSIGHKYMSIRPLDEQKCPLDIQMSTRALDEWTLSNGKHSSLLSTWGQTQSDYSVRLSQINSSRSLRLGILISRLLRLPFVIYSEHYHVDYRVKNIYYFFEDQNTMLMSRHEGVSFHVMSIYQYKYVTSSPEVLQLPITLI